MQMALNMGDITWRQFEKFKNLKIFLKFLKRARLSTSEIYNGKITTETVHCLRAD
jgi:hypothetical protein